MKTSLAQRVKKAKEHYSSIPKEKRREKAAARQKWSNLSIKEAEHVSSYEEAKEVFKRAPWGMPAKKVALAKWAEFCFTISELWTVFKITRYRIKGFEDNAVLQKWEALSCIEAHTASTLKEARSAYLDSPWDETGWINGEFLMSTRKAFEKWLGFCSSLEELNDLYILTFQSVWQYTDEKAYLKKYAELRHKEIGNFTS